MSDLDAMARRVIDGNLYMTLATLDPDGRAGQVRGGERGTDHRVPADPAGTRPTG